MNSKKSVESKHYFFDSIKPRKKKKKQKQKKKKKTLLSPLKPEKNQQ